MMHPNVKAFAEKLARVRGEWGRHHIMAASIPHWPELGQDLDSIDGRLVDEPTARAAPWSRHLHTQLLERLEARRQFMAKEWDRREQAAAALASADLPKGCREIAFHNDPDNSIQFIIRMRQEDGESSDDSPDFYVSIYREDGDGPFIDAGGATFEMMGWALRRAGLLPTVTPVPPPTDDDREAASQWAGVQPDSPDWVLARAWCYACGRASMRWTQEELDRAKAKAKEWEPFLLPTESMPEDVRHVLEHASLRLTPEQERDLIAMDAIRSGRVQICRANGPHQWAATDMQTDHAAFDDDPAVAALRAMGLLYDEGTDHDSQPK